MARGIRAIILNTDEDYAIELRSQFLAIDGLKIVAELDEPVLFDNAIKQFPAELIVINLDTDPEGLIQSARQIVENYPDLTIFAVSASDNPQLILQAMRSGVREFLIRPIDTTQLNEAVGRINKLASNHPVAGKLICTLGTVGGVGTTTLATNLGCELAQFENTSAVIVDLDMYFGHVATLLDLSPQFTIADLCQTLDSIDPSMIEKALIKHDCGVSVLARPTHFNQAEQISAANVATVINALCGMFDYVICDGPNRNDSVRPSILDLADTTLITLNLTVPAVRNIDRIMQALSREGYNMDRTQLILSRYTRENNSLSIEDVELSLNRKVAFTVPEESRVISAAVNTGQPLLQCVPKSKVREAIKNMAQTLHNPNTDDSDGKHSSGAGLFARMLGR
jgi:pilus assembly protein CpaE